MDIQCVNASFLLCEYIFQVEFQHLLLVSAGRQGYFQALDFLLVCFPEIELFLPGYIIIVSLVQIKAKLFHFRVANR